MTADGFVRIFWHGEEAGTIPVEPISTEAPVYERPIARPASMDDVAPRWECEHDKDDDRTDDLLRLLASPNLSSKKWIFEQYDSTVRTNTIFGPERSDAGVIRVKGSGGRALALTSDVNPVYCELDPYEGGKQAVAEAARNIACAGGEPVAITDCLNFGSPEKPDVMWQFAECIRGLADACRALATPVVSGNVSFYNDTDGQSILPTPTVGMVGILESEAHRTPLAFRASGRSIVLLGATHDEMGGSEYLQMFGNGERVLPPRVDLAAEKRLIDFILVERRARTIESAHDLSNGGLAIALAECSMDGIGGLVDLSGHADEIDTTALLFGESQARAIVTCDRDEAGDLVERAVERGVPAMEIGFTREGVLIVERDGRPLLHASTNALARLWTSAFALLLAGDTIDDVIAGRGETTEVIGQ